MRDIIQVVKKIKNHMKTPKKGTNTKKYLIVEKILHLNLKKI